MFCINVLLTVKDAANTDTVRDLLTQCGRLSRQEPDCISYVAFQSQADPKLFMLIERWESEAAWQAHKTREAVTTIYLPKVIPLVDRVPHISTLLE
jgi:quinol monooxygenase YgiN